MEEKGGGRGASPPLFWQGGLAPHFSVENKGIIKKKLINPWPSLSQIYEYHETLVILLYFIS